MGKFTKQEFTGRFDGKVDELSVEKSAKDNKGVYTVVTYKRKATKKTYMISTLSNPDANGNYRTRTEKYFDLNGDTQLDTVIYTIAYDADGDVVSEI